MLLVVIFLALPFYVGYRGANYAAFVVPVALIGLAVLYEAGGSGQSSGAQPDEVDVQSGILLIASMAGLLLCLGGIALARQRQDTGG